MKLKVFFENPRDEWLEFHNVKDYDLGSEWLKIIGRKESYIKISEIKRIEVNNQNS